MDSISQRDPAVPVLMNVIDYDLRYMYSKLENIIRENGNARDFYCQNLCFAQIHFFATEDQNVFFWNLFVNAFYEHR